MTYTTSIQEGYSRKRYLESQDNRGHSPPWKRHRRNDNENSMRQRDNYEPHRQHQGSHHHARDVAPYRGGRGRGHRGRGHRGRGRGSHQNSRPNRERFTKKDDFPPHPYSDHLVRLVELEKQAEQEQFIARTERYSPERLEREGLVLFNLNVPRNAGTFCGKPIFEFQVPNRNQFHQFRSGDMVILSEKHPTKDKRVYEGVVLDSGSQSIRVVIDYLPPNVLSWRMDKGANTIVYERQASAVKALVHRNPRTAAEEDEKFDFKRGESPLPVGTYLRDLLVESHEEMRRASQPSAAPIFLSLAAQPPDIQFDLTKLEITPQLTASQKEAIQKCVQRKLTLIQGPPGTGKTTTIIHLVKTLRSMLPKNFPILVSAYTNLAVDQMLQGLLDEGVRALRIGNPIRVNPKYFSATVDSHVEHHTMNREIKNMTDELKSLQDSLKYKSGRDIGLTHRDMALIRKELFKKKQAMMDNIMEEADVVCCTCVGAATDVLETKEFGIVILDECSQITEPSALIPIVHGARMLVMVGDSCQLPPVILSQEAAQQGLNVSLMERMERLSIPVEMLREQFRMHPSICEFPSNAFYQGKLENHASTAQRVIPRGVSWSNPKVPVMFLQTNSPEVSSDQSKKNSGQARIVVQLLEQLMRTGGNDLEIGVITPYLAQTAEIMRHAHKQGRLGDQMSSKEEDRIEVKSVDGFQGREKDLIILSTVRSNAERNVGFLDDWRRLNVAITRAKCGLIVVGDRHTLRSDRVWSDYLAYLDKNGLVQDAEHVVG